MSHPEGLNITISEWVQQRTEALLAERSWHVRELQLIIHHQLAGLVERAVLDYTQPRLATGHLQLDRHLRLTPNI